MVLLNELLASDSPAVPVARDSYDAFDVFQALCAATAKFHVLHCYRTRTIRDLPPASVKRTKKSSVSNKTIDVEPNHDPESPKLAVSTT